MTEPRAVEGELVLHCTVCGREIKVRWFVDEEGPMKFVLDSADVDSAEDMQLVCRLWMAQN